MGIGLVSATAGHPGNDGATVSFRWGLASVYGLIVFGWAGLFALHASHPTGPLLGALDPGYVAQPFGAWCLTFGPVDAFGRLAPMLSLIHI